MLQPRRVDNETRSYLYRNSNKDEAPQSYILISV